MLTIVAAMGYGRPIFLSPPDKREEANAAKKKLTGASAAAKSDHLTLIAAFNSWNQARLKGGRSEASRVTPPPQREYPLSPKLPDPTPDPTQPHPPHD
jgi:hypothetical protein